MLSIAEHIEFIKRQRDFYERTCARLTEKAASRPDAENAKRVAEKIPMNAWLFNSYERLLAAMLNDINKDQNNENLVAFTNLTATNKEADLELLLSQPTNITPANLDGLPPELIEQLQISDSDRFQWDMVDLINRTPEKIIAIEVLLIALYKKTGKVYERTDLANKIYRLARKNVIFGVAGKKGWYTTVPQNGELELVAPDESESLA